MGTFIEVTLHTVCHFMGESSLYLAAAQGAGYAGAVLPVIRIGGTNAQFFRPGSTAFATAFLEFPAIHQMISFHQGYAIPLVSVAKKRTFNPRTC